MAGWKIGSALRLFLLSVGLVIWLGIWLTGFDQVHWVLYIPAGFLVIAAITGICPGMFLSRMIFFKKT